MSQTMKLLLKLQKIYYKILRFFPSGDKLFGNRDAIELGRVHS